MTAPLKHASRPIRAVFSPNGTELATATENGVLQLWDAQTGDRLTEPLANPLKSDPWPWDSRLNTVDMNFSEDGQSLIIANRGAVSIFRVPNRGTRFSPGTNAVTALELSPDGKQVLVLIANSNRFITTVNATIMDALSGEEKWRVSDVSKAVWSFDGKTILTEEGASPVRLFDAARGVPIASNITADLFQGSIQSDLVLEMDCQFENPKGGGARFTGAVSSGSINLGAAADAQTILPLTFTVLKFRDLSLPTQSEKKARIELRDSLVVPTYAILNPAGDLLLLGRADKTFCAYTVSNGIATGPPLHLTDQAATACFSPDRRRIAILCADGSIGCWDVDLRRSYGYVTDNNKKVHKPVCSFLEPDILFSTNGAYVIARSEINRIIESPNGRNVPGVGANTSWQIFDAGDMHEVFRPPPPSSLGYGKAKSASSQTLSGMTNNFARVFDAKTSKIVTPALNHLGPVLDVKLSPDERFVATASEDGTARIWDADSGEPVTPPLRHSAPVTAVAFFPDNARLLTGSADGSLRTWICRSADDPIEDLEILADVNSGRRVARNGSLVPLAADEMQTVLRTWSKKYPPRFARSQILQELESQLQVWEVLFNLREPNASILHFGGSAIVAQSKRGAKVVAGATIVRGGKQIMGTVIETLKEDFRAIEQLDSAREDRLNKLRKAADRLP